jgi:hypothetical protein
MSNLIRSASNGPKSSSFQQYLLGSEQWGKSTESVEPPTKLNDARQALHMHLRLVPISSADTVANEPQDGCDGALTDTLDLASKLSC